MRLGAGALAVCFPFAGPRLELVHLRRALARTVREHPLLSASIRPCPDHPTLPSWTVEADDGPGPGRFTCTEDTSGAPVAVAMERCLGLRYTPDAADARIRCILLRSPADGDGLDCLLFGTHHLFFDGDGFHRWLRRLFVALEDTVAATDSGPPGLRTSTGVNGTREPVVSIPPSDYEMTLQLWRERRGDAPFPPPRFTACAPSSRVLIPRPSPLMPFVPPLPVIARLLPRGVLPRLVGRGIHIFTLDRQRTSAFLAACRRRGVGPTAALIGAFGHAALATGGRPGDPYVPAVPIDLRSRLSGTNRDMRSSFASGITAFFTDLRLDPRSSAWDIAAEWQARFVEERWLEAQVASWIWAREWASHHDVAHWPYPHDCSVFVSNVGVLDAVVNAPSHRWQAVHTFVAGFEQPFTLLGATLNGRLSITLSFPVPMWSRKTGADVAERLRAFVTAP